jgi:hypothetical protein
MRYILFIFIAFALSACGGIPVTREKANAATFAAQPTDEDAVQYIRNYLDDVLIDPSSLRLKCSKVLGKGWARENFISDEPLFGYLVSCDVNSKNRMGGYTGGKHYVFIINGSRISGFDFTGYGDNGPGRHFGLIQ